MKKPRGNRFRRPAAPPRPPLGPRVRTLARRGRPYALALFLAGALGGGGFAGWHFLLTSPRFAIRDLRFGALRHTSAAELARRLPLALGDNLFRADLRAAERALAEDAWITGARLHRELPGTVVIDLSEREPAAAVHLGGLYLCDRTGAIFKRATLAEVDGLLTVTGLDRELYVDDPASAQTLIREALEAAEAWARAGRRPALSEASVHPILGVSLFLRAGGAEIRLGRGDLERKLSHYDLLARELLRRGEQARAVYLDSLTRPDRVAVRLQPASEGG